MKRSLFIVCVNFLLNVTCLGQSYGLTFNSHEAVQEKRTSLDLSPDTSFCLGKAFNLSFDIGFMPNHQVYFGYIFRIISNDNQNVNLIFNEGLHLFEIVAGEKFSGINFTIDSLKLYKEWNNFNLKFDLSKHNLQFYVNGKLTGESSLPSNFSCLKFLWGANDYEKFKTRDIPPMKIKDIRIFEQNKLKYYWSLDETSGDLCYDKINKQVAKVKNPVWLKPQYQQWQLLDSFLIKGYASSAFDIKNDKLYITGADSLVTFDFKKENVLPDIEASQHQNLLLGHQAIYDSLTRKLYDVYIDQQKVVSFDISKKHWEEDFMQAPTTEFWHANKFISAVDSSLYVIGGYGQLKYKNLVQRYHFPSKKWQTISITGDYFQPRYLAALGTDAKGAYAYIIGGYGSKTGDQMLDPTYYYDLFLFDVQKKTFRKLYSFKQPRTQFTFANSLITGPKPDDYYGLIFPNDSFNSNLQLVKGSLKDSTFQLFGHPIPYNFHDIQSFADLYYSPSSNKLIAITFFYSREDVKDKTTKVKLYSLNFPPEQNDTPFLKAEQKLTSNYLLIPLIIAVLCAGAGYVLFKKSVARKALTSLKEGREIKSIAGAGLEINEPYLHENGGLEKTLYPAIYLFGRFQVIDKEGVDITRLFTPLLKELFLVISIHSIKNGKGISSESLNEILWHNKSEKDAKNNRAVNIAKLKTILEKTGGCVMSKESGFWQLHADESVYIDYKKFVSLLQSHPGPGKEYIEKLTAVTKRGGFLTQTEYTWLDDIKSEISNAAIDLFLGFVNTQDICSNPEWFIEIINCIFYFDPLNEDALIYKCKALICLKRHTLANNIYLKFIKEYKTIYGEDFSKSFHEIVG